MKVCTNSAPWIRHFRHVDFHAGKAAQPHLTRVKRVGVGLGQADGQQRDMLSKVVNLLYLVFLDIGLTEGGDRQWHRLHALLAAPGGNHDLLKAASARGCLVTARRPRPDR